MRESTVYDTDAKKSYLQPRHNHMAYLRRQAMGTFLLFSLVCGLAMDQESVLKLLLEEFPDLCEADRRFARHVAMVWANDLPWEQGLPPDIFPINIEWRRRNREMQDIWRRETGRDWVRTSNGRIGP